MSCIKQLVNPEREKVNNYVYSVNNKPIIHIFDIPHPLKNIRNSLYNYDIVYANQKQIVKIKYVPDGYNMNKNNRMKALVKVKHYSRFTKLSSNTA